MLFHTKAVWH